MTAEQRRAQWNYETRTPLCCNCAGYKKATIDAKGAHRPKCKKGGFEVEAGACCDKWSSRTGERLR